MKSATGELTSTDPFNPAPIAAHPRPRAPINAPLFLVTCRDLYRLCCAWGSGGYALEISGVVIVTGGVFGESVSHRRDHAEIIIEITPRSSSRSQPILVVRRFAIPYVFSPFPPSPPPPSPSPPPSPPPPAWPADMPMPPSPPPATYLTVSVFLDQYPEESTWELTSRSGDNAGTMIAVGGPYPRR